MNEFTFVASEAQRVFLIHQLEGYLDRKNQQLHCADPDTLFASCLLFLLKNRDEPDAKVSSSP